MYFKDIIGQADEIKFFLQQIQTGKLHHANLISGKLGFGGLTLGLAIARYVQCEDMQPEDSCGACNSCRKFNKLIHPDVFFTYPTFKSKEVSKDFIESWRNIVFSTKGYFNLSTWLDLHKEKNAKIRVEDCDQILKNFVLTSYEGNSKIQIIWMTELIGQEINKLLKIFEEPPDKSIFILIAENIESILPTVISRCQTIRLKQIENEVLITHLGTEFPDRIEDIKRIVPICHGDYLEAKSLLQDAQENLNAAVFKWCRYIVNNAKGKNIENIRGLVKFIEGMSGLTKEEIKAFFQFYLHFLHESFLLKYSKHCNLADDLMKVAQYFADQFEIDQFEALQKLTDTTHYEIERNGSAKLVLMNYAIKSSKVLNRLYFEELKH